MFAAGIAATPIPAGDAPVWCKAHGGSEDAVSGTTVVLKLLLHRESLYEDEKNTERGSGAR